MTYVIKNFSGSSNKYQTLAWNAATKAVEEAQAYELPTPFIDRLYVTVEVPNVQLGKDIWAAYNVGLLAFQDLHKTKPSKGYSRALRVELPSVIDHKKWPFLELAVAEGVALRLRIDLIPADLGFGGMQDLHDALRTFIPDGWAFFIKHGRISRLDVTLDFQDLTMEDLHFRPALGITTKQWSRSGKLESFQLGKAKASHTLIYDRAAKRKSQNKPFQGKEGVRVERRLKGQSYRFSDLAGLECVFGCLGLAWRNLPLPNSIESHHWEMFLLAADFVGMPAALAVLPTKVRTVYRKHVFSNLIPAWDLDAIWQCWPGYLEGLQICNEAAWT